MTPILTPDDLDEALSRPTNGVLETLRSLEGDVMVLGAGGKMGPTLARMVRRGLDEIGQPQRNPVKSMTMLDRLDRALLVGDQHYSCV